MHQLIESSEREAESFAAFYTRFFPKVRRMARNRTGDEKWAEDITQDIFLQLWEDWMARKTVLNWESYFKILVRNRYLDFLRRKKSLAYFKTLQFRELNATYLPNMEHKDYRLKLHAAINNLPPAQKRVMTLKFIYGFKTREVSSLTGSAIPTIKSQVQTATRKLQVWLEAV